MQIPIKPLSVNKKFTINKRSRFLIKSNATRDYENALTFLLLDYRKDIKEFLNGFNPKCHALHFYVTVYCPLEVYYTKDGKMSSRCIDASNVIKILEDKVYKIMEIGDHFNTKVTAEKLPHHSQDWITKIEIKKVEKPFPT